MKQKEAPNEILEEFAYSDAKGNYKVKELFAPELLHGNDTTIFDYTKWKWLASCPHKISNQCCMVMKKSPAHTYQRLTGRNGITGQTASESRLRTLQWLHNGCNGFDMKRPISNPLSFWLEQDILLYIYKNHIPIASVYGDVVIDYAATGDVEGQMSLSDVCQNCGVFDDERPLLKTTGAKRTGCMFCGYGCHLEKPGQGRFELMKKTHPKQYEYIFKPVEQGGLGYKEVIDWINEHGNLHIRY